MLASPWDVILTVAFAVTGAFCLWHVAAPRPNGRPQAERVIDMLHLIMSVAMVVMIWIPFGTIGTWIQAAVFAVLGILLLGSALSRSLPRTRRADLVSHVMLSAAMVWMLAAMPLMMAGMPMPSGGSGGGHEGHAMPAASDGSASGLAATPGWVDVVSWALVALCAVVVGWWAFRVATDRRHRGHRLCHLGMGAGMGLMLALMVS